MDLDLKDIFGVVPSTLKPLYFASATIGTNRRKVGGTTEGVGIKQGH